MIDIDRIRRLVHEFDAHSDVVYHVEVNTADAFALVGLLQLAKGLAESLPPECQAVIAEGWER